MRKTNIFFIVIAASIVACAPMPAPTGPTAIIRFTSAVATKTRHASWEIMDAETCVVIRQGIDSKPVKIAADRRIVIMARVDGNVGSGRTWCTVSSEFIPQTDSAYELRILAGTVGEFKSAIIPLVTVVGIDQCRTMLLAEDDNGRTTPVSHVSVGYCGRGRK
jgi:hypothetical protein